MLKALAIYPVFDHVTEYSAKWCKKLIEHLKSKCKVVEVGGRRVKREEVEGYIKGEDPYIVIFYDHGREGAWFGSEGEHVIDLRNVSLLSGRIAYSMSCRSAKILGREAFKKKCKVFVGYVEDFVFNVKDEEIFCRAVNYGLIIWLEGEEDWINVKRKWIDYWNKLIDEADDPWTKMWLRHDRDSLRIIAEGVDEPETKCPARKTAVKLFGSAGWRISRETAVSVLFFAVGFTMAVLDVSRVLGEIIMLFSYTTLIYEYLKLILNR